MKVSTYILGLLVLALPLAGCGGQEPEIITTSDTPGLGSVYKKMRRDAELGVGGWFKFTIDSVEYPTEWGYADFHPSANEAGSRLVLLNNAVGGGGFPLLRIVAFADISAPAQLQGQTLRQQSLILKMEKKKKSKGWTGSVDVTFDSIEGDWIEGSFTGSVSPAGEEKEILGSFKVRLNIPDELR